MLQAYNENLDSAIQESRLPMNSGCWIVPAGYDSLLPYRLMDTDPDKFDMIEG